MMVKKLNDLIIFYSKFVNSLYDKLLYYMLRIYCITYI